MLALPVTGSPLREMFEVQQLLRPRELPTFRQCAHAARSTFAASGPEVRAVNSVCLRADGAIELVKFGPKGGHKTMWKFGKP